MPSHSAYRFPIAAAVNLVVFVVVAAAAAFVAAVGFSDFGRGDGAHAL